MAFLNDHSVRELSSTRWYVLDRRAIIMLTSRMTPMTRKTPNSKRASVTEALSTESKGSNSAIPSRDQVRCFTILHQQANPLDVLQADSVPLLLEMNDLSAMYTFVMAIENAKIVAINCQKIVITSPMI